LIRSPVADTRGQSLVRRLADQVGVAGSGDLLRRKRKHSGYKTPRSTLVFPEAWLITLQG